MFSECSLAELCNRKCDISNFLMLHSDIAVENESRLKTKTFLLERLTFNKISSKDTSTLQECSMQCSVCTHTSDFIRCYECSI